MAIIQGDVIGGSAGFYPKEIEQSLRFNDDDSAYLSWTPASAGNRKTWTFSFWHKRGNLGINDIVTNDYTGSTEYAAISIGTDDQLNIESRNSSDVYIVQFKTARKFRDVGAWYHIAIKVDTTQATQSERFKLFINGEQETSFATAVYPAQNADTTFLKQKNTNIFKHGNSSIYGDGYLADVHFTDGTAYDATAFGEFKNGVWVAKTPNVVYGANGFYLDFADGGALGNDVSGNNNDWTATNLASTDVMLDSPTNNFATLNPIAPSVGSVGSEGNLRSSLPSSNVPHFATQAIPATGKWYFEVRLNSAAVMSDYNQAFGIRSLDSTTYFHAGIKSSDITLYSTVNGTNYGGVSSGSSAAVGDVYGMAVDRDANTIVIYRNGTAIYSGNNMAQHLGEENQDLLPYVWRYTSYSANESINFGQDSSFAGLVTPSGYTDANGRGDFYYAPPAGYLALCTANLPEPAIGPNSASTSDEHFNTVLYTGDGASSHAITGVGFQPDFVWGKCRDYVYSNTVMDVLRGTDKILFTNTTDADTTETNNITSFDSDGFSLGSSGNFNASGRPYVAWNWKANGSGVSNTDGSITSTVSANVDAGFSIVSYTGNSSISTVGHGLNTKPDMVIVKNRTSAENWRIYHSSIGATGALKFTTDTPTYLSAYWNNTEPTPSVFTVNNAAPEVNENGSNFIAYCFHSVEGFSKFGSYTGNGSAWPNSPFIYTGFRPALIMIKRTDSSANWMLYDSKRDGYNYNNDQLYPNLSNAENDGQADGGYINLLSNGFKLNNTAADKNASGGTYIYMAFAENPFKYSNAR